MEYQKIINLLDSTKNQPSKFRTRNWVEYSDTYTHVKGTMTVPNTAAAVKVANNTDKKVKFKSCAPFTDYINEINKDIDVAK